MAELIIEKQKIQANITSLSDFFAEHGIKWSLITKVFSGDREFLKEILTDEILEGVHSVGDSRLSSLQALKEFNPDLKTIYIKPPAEVYVEEVIRWADISMNTSLPTIKALNDEAAKQSIKHQIIIMIELGELREGVKRSELMEFYQQVFELPHIDVIGLGSNLGCMYGVEPSYDKLLQLSLYKELISERFDKNIELLSGGSSITLPMVESRNIPREINHFRVGEAAFFGISPLDNQRFRDLAINTFILRGNIIELEEKRVIPDGVIGDANVGHTARLHPERANQTSVKAILDFGMLDVDKADIEPVDDDFKFVGITSDMLVLDLGDNLNEHGQEKYRVGDQVDFRPNYMAVARLLNSKFIGKSFV